MLGLGLKLGTTWQTQDVLRLRTEVLSELDAALADGAEARLQCALEKIAALEHAEEPLAQLRRFLLIVAVIAHHARWGGLSERQATQLFQIGEALLKANGVEQSTSTLSLLWGELHLAQSQVQKQAGDAWQAAWQQHYSHFVSRRTPVGTPAFQALSRAMRAFRLGYMDLAMVGFRHAEQGELPPRSKAQARLCRIQALRVSGYADVARLLCDGGLEPGDVATSELLGEDFADELAWERVVIDAQMSGDLGSMLALLGRGGRGSGHRRGAFLLEGFLWTRALQSRRFEDRMPTLETIRKNARDDINACDTMKALYSSALQIETCYDNVRPLALRLSGLGDVLGDGAKLPSFDKELLVHAAAFRWLIRSKQHGFATLVLAAYQARSRVATSGRSADALNVLTDVDVERYTSPTFDLE